MSVTREVAQLVNVLELEAESLRAENQQLRDALERIAENAESWELPPRGIVAIASIARAALAAVRVEERG